jgi:hypothetical protein
LKPAQAKKFARPYLGKPFTKTGLVEWLKVKALSSSPSTEKKIKYLGIYLPKMFKTCTLKIMLLKEIKEDLNKWKDIHIYIL